MSGSISGTASRFMGQLSGEEGEIKGSQSEKCWLF